jgi:lipopolysaccharide/colanic/teichoic acid biosynthesis glycosyltransferase
MHRGTPVINLSVKSRRRHIKGPSLRNLYYISGLPVIFFLAMFIAWGKISFNFNTVLLGSLFAIVYAATLVNRYKTIVYRSRQSIGLSGFYITIGFILILFILAVSRLYYSRTFLGIAYAASMGWYGFGVLILKRPVPDLLVISGGLSDKLKSLAPIGWRFISKNNAFIDLKDYDGIIVDTGSLEVKRIWQIVHHNSNIPLLDANRVYKHITGRVPAPDDYVKQKGLFEFTHQSFYRIIKRGIDILTACIIGVLSAPVMAVSAVIIRLESEGPALFRQRRIGKNNKPFTLYKFRSMHISSEKNGPQFTQKNDGRATAFGKFIRKYRIDELPQLWNVLKGEMSLIGPRPEQSAFVEYFGEEIPFYWLRHKIRPGITGWAQVKEDYDYIEDLDSTKKKLEYDLYYLENISLSIDLFIIYSTFRIILGGFGSG